MRRVRFLAYVAAALHTVAPTASDALQEALLSLQPLPVASLLTILLNTLSDLPHPVTLVLDDYHLLDAPPVDRALTYLIERLPPQLHVVIATREDPPLPLAHWRAQGQLREVRADDLRFTPAEAADFLLQVMGLPLRTADVAALESRTEGWIAGLQLAALSMQGRSDLQGFIRFFTGDHRYIVDYLVEEVLVRLPAALRSFLLHTAILRRLSGPLCSAVTGQSDGDAMLERLERSNLFVVPLATYQRGLMPQGTYVMAGGTTRQMLQVALLGPLLSKKGGQTLGLMLARATQADLVTLQQMIDAGQVTPVIDREYPLTQAAKAVRYVEAGHAAGKVVLRVAEEAA